jgi:hypothetical protein
MIAFTPEQIAEIKSKFIEKLKEKKVVGNVSVACDLLGYCRSLMYVYKSEDAEFSKVWDEAVDAATEKAADLVEDKLFKNAYEKENVTAQIFFLKNKRPKVWSDRHIHEGNADNPIAVKMEVPGLEDWAVKLGETIKKDKENVGQQSDI